MASDLDDHSVGAAMPGELFTIVTGGFHRCDPSWDGGWRHEPHTKIYVPRSGAACYDVGAGEVTLRPGRVHLLPGGRRHRWRCPRRMTVDWLHVRVHEPRLEGAIAALPDVRSWPTAGLAAWRPAWRGLGGLLPDRPLATVLRLQAFLAWIGALLLESAPGPAPRPLPPAVARALAFLDEHHRRRPPLAATARAAGLSPVHFHRVFVAALGVTPHAWAERRRLDAARELLADAELPIAEVARRSGYADPFHFSRAFRRAHGRSPSAWRRDLLAPTP